MNSRFSLVLIAIALITVVPPSVGFTQKQSEIETVSQSATEFAFDLYHRISVEEKHTGKNLFFSPYSIYTVLALMYGGAAGETAEQMASALYVQTEPEGFPTGMAGIQDILNQIGKRRKVELNIANSLWPQSSADLKSGFLELAKRYFAEVYPVDYRREAVVVRKRINSWGEKKTNGRIKEIINWDLHPETHLLLANAIYFKGDWRWRFDPDETENMPFHRLDAGTIEVPMMQQLGGFPLAWTDSAQILQLPYKGGDLSMTIVLPDKPDGLPALEQQINPVQIASWQKELHEMDVYVFLPRFEIISSFDLISDGSLKALGIVRALHGGKAEFPGIGEPANWFSIQRFVQKAFVKVNEEGTEAAAVTVGGCFPAGTLVPTPLGFVPIEAINTGTNVYAFDLTNGDWTTAPVIERRTWPFAGEMVTIHLDSDTIEVTWNHPFLVAQGADLEARRVPMDLPTGEAVSTNHGRWVEARDIREGDVLRSRRDGTVTVRGVSKRNMTGEMYFLQIDEFHNHAVGQRGILVHNGDGKESAGPPTFTFMADHPFLFYIQDEPTGSILFMGRVMDPSVE